MVIWKIEPTPTLSYQNAAHKPPTICLGDFLADEISLHAQFYLWMNRMNEITQSTLSTTPTQIFDYNNNKSYD